MIKLVRCEKQIGDDAFRIIDFITNADRHIVRLLVCENGVAVIDERKPLYEVRGQELLTACIDNGYEVSMYINGHKVNEQPKMAFGKEVRMTEPLVNIKRDTIRAIKDFISYQNCKDGDMYKGYSEQTIYLVQNATSEKEIDRIMRSARAAANH